MSPSWRFTQMGSLSGVSVVGPEIVWASGSFDVLADEAALPATVLRTLDRGRSWEEVTPSGVETLRFHDIQAFDRDQAVVLAVGQDRDSRIYRTGNGGAHWDLVFQNEEKTAFYDGIAFFDGQRGLALSDPVDGKFRILQTGDGGRTWNVVPSAGMPPAMPNEGVHATGTALVTWGSVDAWFGTGLPGPQSRVFHTRDGGVTWSVASVPIAGPPKFGMSSLAFRDAQHGWALGGGNPVHNQRSMVAETTDGGQNWAAVGSLNGFRFSLAWVPTNSGDTLVAVGRSGSDFSTDGGHTWQEFDTNDLRGIDCKPHVACWAVGKCGKAAELVL